MKNDNDAEAELTSILPADTPRHQDDDRQQRHHSTRSMKIRRLPMWRGWSWLIEGFMLWARNPAFLSFLTFCWLFGIIVAATPPYVGELLALILYPGLMLGVFNGCRAIDRKRKLSPGLLISGFRRHAYDLLLAGFCNFIVLTVVLLSTRLIDGGMMVQLAFRAEIPDPASFTSPPFLYSLLVTTILFTLWGMVYLFVPQLIGWWRLSVTDALVFSLKGCLFNWLPFLTYGFCFSFFVITLSFLVINFFGLTVDGLGIVVCAVFLLIITPTLIASFYVAARDIFGFPRRRKHRRRQPDQTLDGRRKRRMQT